MQLRTWILRYAGSNWDVGPRLDSIELDALNVPRERGATDPLEREGAVLRLSGDGSLMFVWRCYRCWERPATITVPETSIHADPVLHSQSSAIARHYCEDCGAWGVVSRVSCWPLIIVPSDAMWTALEVAFHQISTYAARLADAMGLSLAELPYELRRRRLSEREAKVVRRYREGRATKQTLDRRIK